MATSYKFQFYGNFFGSSIGPYEKRSGFLNCLRWDEPPLKRRGELACQNNVGSRENELFSQ